MSNTKASSQRDPNPNEANASAMKRRKLSSTAKPEGDQEDVDNSLIETFPRRNDQLGRQTSSSTLDVSQTETAIDSNQSIEVQVQAKGTRPNIKSVDASGSTALQERLRSFLPKMAHANDQLSQSNGPNIEDVSDGDPHIAMDLGLGVLREKDVEDSDSVKSSDNDSESASDHSSEGENGQITESLRQSSKDKAILHKLLGQPRTTKPISIEEV